MILSAPCLASIRDYKITLHIGERSEFRLRQQLRKQYGKLEGIRILHLPEGTIIDNEEIKK